MTRNNRLIHLIHSSKGKKLFCAFVTLGYPNLNATEKLIRRLDAEGVDIIELGYPFSDPLADGPTIQFSSEQALKKGVSMRDAFRLVSKLRRSGCRVPIVFFSYLNPIFHFGIREFAKTASQNGFDGLIVPDLPPEEEPELQKYCRRANLAQIFLVAPTTRKDRIKKIAGRSRGFIYYVSLRGVTGARKALPAAVKLDLQRVRRSIKKPVLVGFGVSTPDQGKALSRFCDGVIVGSGLIDRIRRSGGRIEPAVRFARSMVRSLKKSR